jgi:RNA recognition motif. (a.k.a. RRM, RBD, or RNP domain)
MSPFPNQILNDNSRTLKPEYFQSVDDFAVPGTTNKNLQYFPQSPTMDSSSSTRTLSDDSSEVIDQGQYSDLNTHQWEEGGVSVFDGIELPVITDANLYIKNIDYDISDETLYSVFSQLGEITSHHIIRDATKRSRGFGFM